jgi:hypothetical protein
VTTADRERRDWGAGPLLPEAEARFIAGVECCGRFFMDRADAQKALDVQELIRSAALGREVASELHPWVRDRFLELWDLAQVKDPF